MCNIMLGDTEKAERLLALLEMDKSVITHISGGNRVFFWDADVPEGVRTVVSEAVRDALRGGKETQKGEPKMTKKQYGRGRDLTGFMGLCNEHIRKLKREKQRMSSAYLDIGFERISVPNECREEIVDLLLDYYTEKREAARQEFEKL